MAQDIFGVEPGSDDYSHEVVISSGAKKYGLKLQRGVKSIHIIPPPRQSPVIKLEQNSWHAGRGAEIWFPNAYNFYDSMNMWTTTPNKLHPSPLLRWYSGMRDAETNMPVAGSSLQWIPLYAGSGSDPYRRYLDVSFIASATSNRERCFLIFRRRGTPKDNLLTVEWCTDSGGNPNTVSKTVTKTITNFPDITSYYMEFKPSSVLAVTSTTVYHIKVYGGANDNPENCWEVLCQADAAGKNSSDNSSWTATAYSPFYRITDADINQRVFTFPFDGAWYAVTSRVDRAASKLYIFGNRGKATAGASTTLTDTGAGQYGGTWTTNLWATTTAETWKIRIVRGTGQGQVRQISSNTGTVITVSVAWDINPDSTSEYVIYGGSVMKEITGHGLGWVSDKPKYANGIVYFPQNDTVDIRIMQLNYANASDHGFDAEDTNHNRAWFLTPSFDASLGPIMMRANQVATSSGAPNGKAVSVGRSPTSPSGTPISFGTDMTFQTSILVGDNTFRFTGMHSHQNQIYLAKEDKLYLLVSGVPTELTYGVDASPNILNGVAACTGTDNQFYIAAEHDVFWISGGSSIPLGLPSNLPSNRAGYVMDMISEKGWLFAALDAADGYSSVMRMTLQDRTWHEQIRGFAVGRRIRGVTWLNWVETRPHLSHECQGELLYQEMPLYGVRPVQDTSLPYQHEGIIEFQTMDLLNTDPKFFSYFELVSKKLATADYPAAYGREIALDYQLNDNIGSATWIPTGTFGLSPQDKVDISLGTQFKIRPRLRIESNKTNNPPIVENLALSLFSRTKQYSSILLDVLAQEEDDVSGEEIWHWLIDRVLASETVWVESVFSFIHNRRMVLPAEPNTNIITLNEDSGFDGTLQLYMEFLPE